MKIKTDPSADDDIISMILSGDSADAQHPRVLAIGERIASGELTHAQARPLLRATLQQIIAQELFWESAFVN